MLKNKTKEQLLELLYQANNENFNLQTSYDKQAEILKSIADLYRNKGFFARLFNFFALPWKILQTLKAHNEYFYTIQNHIEMANLTKEQCIVGQKAVIDFENKKIASADYQKLVMQTLGLDTKTCSTCGDIAGRLHDDFQKRITAECVAKYPELLPTPPTLKSGQFWGGHYFERMQTYTFKGLVGLLSDMKVAAINAKSRGNLPQHKAVLEDAELLKQFIEARKAGQNEVEETTGTVDLGVEAVEGDLETFDLPDEEIEDFVLETESNKFADDVEDILEGKDQPETNEAAKKKQVYTDEEAFSLREKGMNLTDLGIYYGVSATTVMRKLDKYIALLESEKAKNEIPNE